MQAFLFTRLLRALVTVFLVLSFAFVILRMSGDPAMMIMSADAPPEALAAFRRAWGLDASLWEQYGEFFRNLLQGNFGRSMRDGRPAIAHGASEIALQQIAKELPILLPQRGVQSPGAPEGGERLRGGISRHDHHCRVARHAQDHERETQY